ncbi:MAG: hypothetical protein OXH81_26280 [Gemmatimonadetes bacterium]|nr:hypothetical protein [Gemmatimonadota bacterium]
MTNPPLTPEERLSRLEGVYEHLATKADITRLEGEIKRLEGGIKAEGTRLEGKITRLEGKITRLEGEVKAAMAELKTELHKGLNRNLYITIGAVVAVAALVKYLP